MCPEKRYPSGEWDNHPTYCMCSHCQEKDHYQSREVRPAHEQMEAMRELVNKLYNSVQLVNERLTQLEKAEELRASLFHARGELERFYDEEEPPK